MKRAAAASTASRGPTGDAASAASAMKSQATDSATPIHVLIIVVPPYTTLGGVGGRGYPEKPRLEAGESLIWAVNSPGSGHGGEHAPLRGQDADPHRPRHDLRPGPPARD